MTQFQLSNIIIEFVQLANMKAIFNSQLETHVDNQPNELLQKRLTELQNTNKDREAMIFKMEKEVSELEATNTALEEELKKCEEEWKNLEAEQQQQKCESEDEQEMNQWIESVQKHNGLPQQAIDSLLTMEFEGGENEICLSCYSELNAGTLCTYLPCSHLFHKDCIGNHLKINKHCPACQQAVVL